MVKQPLTLYYDSREGDLKKMIDQLIKSKDSRFSGRSVSEVGTMLLREALKAELVKLKNNEST